MATARECLQDRKGSNPSHFTWSSSTTDALRRMLFRVGMPRTALASATDEIGTVTSFYQMSGKESHVIRQRISLVGQPASRIRVRHPQWADEVLARDGWGRLLEIEAREGWITTRKPVTDVLFVYSGALYAENRFCQRLPDGPKDGQPFVLAYGPKLLAIQESPAKPPAWPSTLEALEAQGFRPLSTFTRNKPACFVMGLEAASNHTGK